MYEMLPLASNYNRSELVEEGATVSVLENWEHWKSFLGDRLESAEDDGLSHDVVSDVAFEVGDYLAKEVEPQNEQERVLKDMWNVADEQEQHAIANMMVKLVQRD
ncbi:hypothetical protein JCM19037_195 [Geomicrobium sp. JCM 19037]|nr:hypothetical protein JCM19037_195 [Geomicrobium sp. JCM 19037]GAK10981.1 hypothetical protein JCM19039_645 [Geomicrobium sp. JCM 19039]